MIAINLFHAFVVFPLLLLLCSRILEHLNMMPIRGISKEAIQALMVVAGLGMLFHLMKVIKFVQQFGLGGLMDKDLLMM
jgi:hypothetical protein